MITIYKIFAEVPQDIVLAKKAFNADYAFIKREIDKDTKHSNICVVMGLSQNDGFMSKVINENEGKRGRPKKKFVRDEKSGFYHTSIPHETHLHQHIYIGVQGKGASTIAKKLCERHNEKHEIKWDNRKHDDNCIPYDYVKNQSLSGGFATIGNHLDYL